MAEFETPEIRRVDLAAPVLTVRGFAEARDPRDFGWFDRPGDGPLERADRLLADLGMVTHKTAGQVGVEQGSFQQGTVQQGRGGVLTEVGQQASRIPAHPRIARMMVEARERGCVDAAADVAGLLTERELRRDPSRIDLDVEREALRSFADRGARPGDAQALGFDFNALRAVLRARDRFAGGRRRGGGRSSRPSGDAAALGCALIAGFPDRVVRNDGRGEGQMATGQGVTIADPNLREQPLLIALRVGDGGSRAATRAKVTLAAVIDREWLELACPGSVVVERAARFGDDGAQVIGVTRTKFFTLVLEEKRGGGKTDAAAVEALLAETVQRDPWRYLGEQKNLKRFLSRLRWLRALDAERGEGDGFPELGDEAVGAAAAALAPGRRSLRAFKEAPVLDVLGQNLTRAQHARLKREAPERIAIGNGRELRIDYDDSGREPHVASRLQDFFGVAVTPCIGGGKVPLTLHLLAPNRRAVQVTSDLASFWSTVYPKVRSELRNRYPRHAWPEDPLTAAPDRPGRRRRPS